MKGSEAKGQDAHEESLVPLIEEEEHRLAALIEEARRQAGKVVERAELAGVRRVQTLRDSLPKTKEEKKTRAWAAVEKEADELRREASAALGALRAAAEKNRPQAVEAVVAAVWPASR